MALVQHFGKPDLFITMMCNPDWPEIQRELGQGETAQERPDIVCRIFRAKLQDLKDQLFKQHVLGRVVAHAHVIEFQKRGLPHVHILLIFRADSKITSVEQLDKFVCAEIPDPILHPELHLLVVQHMCHGPCGELNPRCSCMKKGQCKYHYPHPFLENTTQGKDSYPMYRRRSSGPEVLVRSTLYNNKWVVPYNPNLLSRYNCHINVEICSGIKAVKYLYKYIYKGHDRVAFNIISSEVTVDELRQFQEARFVTSQEGLGFEYSVKLDRHRGDRYGDSPLSQSLRRSPSSYRVPLSGGDRSFDSPPNHAPGGVGGFRHLDGRGGVGDGFDPIGAGGGGGRGFEQNFEVPLQPAPAPPITGQKRAFPFSGGVAPPGSDRLDGPGFAKLFVGSVPRTATEEEIRPPFEEYGNVIEVALIKDKRTGQQQGCCFIKYATSEEADRAIRGLHNQCTLPGGVGPVQVRYADGERERLGATEYKLFVGSLHKQATEPEVREIFSPYGRVDDVYLMRDEFRQSRGCGFVKYAQRDMALAAINSLNGIYTMRGCDQPLIVRFADPKRPRPGDSRGGPSFGGPGFGPRFQSPGGIRPPPNNFNEFNGDRVPANTLRPMTEQGQPQPLNAGQFSRPNDVGISQNPKGPVSAPAPSAQMQQQAFNQPFQKYPPGGQQIPPLQNSLQSPQQLTPSLKPQPQPAPSYPQNQTSSHGQQQSGQLQSPFKPPQQNASSATAIQAPPPLSINLQTQQRPSAVSNQQQMGPPSNQKQIQPLQSPSPMAQMLSQQTQALQASFQSSQQAFSQIQQQLQMMQPPNQNMAMQQQQQSTHPTNQQNHWAKGGGGPQTTARPTGVAPAAEAPSSSANVAPVKCCWTEHTSPDGFKYYYNSATGESRWVEPEELRVFKQQQLQQQKPQAQLPQPQSYPHVLPTQQPSQMQPQLQPQQQHPQQRLQQSQLPSQSAYQASGAMSRQNVQEVAYPQYQVRPHPLNDPVRHQQQQSVSAAQEWMWNNNGNNKQAATTALEELN